MTRARLAAIAIALSIAGPASCRRKAPDAGPLRVVQDFEGDVAIKRWPKDGHGDAALSAEWSADGKRSLKLGPGMMGSFTELATHDFRGYDVLRFQTHNPGGETIVLGIEIQDDHTDFTDRHQSTFGAAPGDRAIEIDFSGGLWRGEENRPYRGKQKTPIDASKITRLAFINRGNGPLYIDAIALVRVPKIATPGGFAFDFGRAGSQVMGQTLGVFDTTRYSPERGYGMLGGAPASLTRPMSYPTPLLGDGLAFDAGGFRVELPGGPYKGWIAFERGGFSEGEQSAYTRAELRVNGAVAHAHDAAASAPHFLFEDTELTDLAQIHDRLIRPAHAIAHFSFDAAAGANVFTIAETGANDLPLRVAGMFLAPATPAGEAFLAAHEQRQREAADRAYAPLDRARRGAGRAAPAAPLVIEPLPVGAQVYPRDWPSHGGELPGEALAVTGAAAAVHLGVYASREGSVRAELSPLAGPGGAELPARVLHGRYLPMRPLGGGAVWLEVNHYRPEADFTIGPDLARSVVVEARVPKRAAPGIYTGRLRLSLGDVVNDVPIRLRVVAVDLPELPIPVGLLMNALPFGPEAVGEPRWWALQEALLDEQASAGLGCVTGGAGLEYALKKGGEAYAFSGDRALRYLALAKQRGLARQVVPYGGFLPQLASQRWDAKAFAAGFAAFAKEHDLPPHALYAYDEPGTPDETRRALDATRRFTAAGLATLGFTSMRRGDALFDELLAATTDPALFGHDAPDLARLRKRGARPWIYNAGLDRYAMGLHLWRNIMLGAAGRLEWIGLFTQGFAFDNLDGREPSPSAWLVHSRLGILPAPRWLAAREGLLDARVRLALEKAVPPGDPALAGWSVDGYRIDRERWSDEALAASRAAMLERIERGEQAAKR